MTRRIQSLKRISLGMIVGAAFAYTSDPGSMRSAWDGLIQQGYGVNVSFRLIPALAGASVVAQASGAFHPGRFGVSVSLMRSRWGVWRRFWIDISTGTLLLMIGAFAGAFVGGGLTSGEWSGLAANTELANFAWGPSTTVAALAVWTTVMTCCLVATTASVGMAFRSRIAAAALPVIFGLTISTVPEVRLGPLLDWGDKVGIFGPPTTTWSQGFVALVILCLAAVIAVRQIAVRQVWPRLWS